MVIDMGYGIIIGSWALSLIMAAGPVCSVIEDCPHYAEQNGIVLRESDEELLKKIAVSEAGNQGPDGMWLVMCVVMNRVESEDFPDTISEVIYQKSQFTSVQNGSFDKVSEEPEGCTEALDRIKAADIAPKIIGFEGKDSDVLDRYFDYVFTFRDHKFYVKKE